MADSVFQDFDGFAPAGPRNEQAEAPEVPEPPSGRSAPDIDQQGRWRDHSKGGRPSSFTAPTVLILVTALINGASRADAARGAGVSPATLYAWLALGKAGHRDYAPLAAAVALIEQRRSAWKAFGMSTGRGGIWKRFRC